MIIVDVMSWKIVEDWRFDGGGEGGERFLRGEREIGFGERESSY